MENKIMRIYYGNDCLPYKDHERTVHYPIVGKIGGGSVITGENNTTTIEFYVGLVGSNSKTWVATIKKPDGTLFYRVLNNGVAKDNDYVVSLDIAEIYANQVGNMVIGLNGYDGTTNISEEDDELIISGNTNCLALGTINILCNYAPQVLTNAYGLDPSDLQLLLTAINQKANKVDTIIVVNQLNSTLEFADNQIVFSITDKKFYRYVESETYPDNYVVATDYYSTSEIDTFLSGKQDTLVSGVNIKTINGETLLGSGNINIQGGGSEEYTAGNGITIDAQNQISADITQGTTNGYIKVGANEVKVYDDSAIVAIAQGKVKSLTISSTFDLTNVKQYINDYGYPCYNTDEEDITSSVLSDDGTIYEIINPSFALDSDYLTTNTNSYIVVQKYTGIPPALFKFIFYKVREDLNNGDIILVQETEQFDWWYDETSTRFYHFEMKVDLSGYATKTYVNNGLATKLSATFSGASAYNNTTTYAVGDRVLYDSKLYRCTTAVSTAEDFDVTKWTEITINDYPTKAGDETITGNWTFGNVTINGKINPNANGFGLTPPDTSGFTANSELLDIASNQTITGEKLVSGTYLDFNDGITNYLHAIYSSSDILLLGQKAQSFVGIGVARTWIDSNALTPKYDGTKDLGASSYRWKNLYLSGAINKNSSGYGLTIPDTSSYTADKEIATTDYFGVKKVSETYFRSLTNNEKLSLIDEYGCIQLLGTFSIAVGGGDITDPILFPRRNFTTYSQGLMVGGSTNQPATFGTWEIINGTTTGNIATFKVLFRGGDQNMSIYKLTNLNQKSFPSYPTTNTSPQVFNIASNGGALSYKSITELVNNETIDNTLTELSFDTISNISLSADRTFTLKTAPTGCLPEYKANITNSGASDITITLPSGTTIKGNVSISSNTFVIPSGSSVEVNIQNGRAIVVEW